MNQIKVVKKTVTNNVQLFLDKWYGMVGKPKLAIYFYKCVGNADSGECIYYGKGVDASGNLTESFSIKSKAQDIKNLKLFDFKII